MQHKHTMIGAFWCALRPCRTERKRRRLRDRPETAPGSDRHAEVIAELEAASKRLCAAILDGALIRADMAHKKGSPSYERARRARESLGDRNPCLECPRFGEVHCCEGRTATSPGSGSLAGGSKPSHAALLSELQAFWSGDIGSLSAPANSYREVLGLLEHDDSTSVEIVYHGAGLSPKECERRIRAAIRRHFGDDEEPYKRRTPKNGR